MAISDRLGNSDVVEFEDSEAHGAETVAAVRFELAPVEQIWHAELEAQCESCGEE